MFLDRCILSRLEFDAQLQLRIGLLQCFKVSNFLVPI
jgi:hypothetical protein